MNAPIRVSLIKLRILGNHLRLIPNAELYALCIYSFDKLCKAALELALIDKPIAERGIVAVTVTEPAVVHNEQFDSQLLSFLGIADEGLLVKIKALKFMGVEINYEINDKLKRGPEGEISTPNSKVKVYVICTNEELMIARDTKEIVEAL